MKKMKKIIALALSFMMVVAMSVAAFASEDAGTFTITAPNTDHQYEIYQIFTGDLSEGTLSNVRWGKNGTGTESEKVDAEMLKTLTDTNGKSDTEKLDVIKRYADLNSTPVATITNEQTYTAAAGYYLIKDQDGGLSGKEDAYTLYIVKVVGNVTIEPKSDVPSFEKKVKDTNDTTGDTTDWQDSADYDIGDEVPFKLTGTVASNYDAYKTYYFAFHDKQENGLMFNRDSVKVFVNGEQITDGYEVETENLEDGETFEVIFKNLKNITSVAAGSKITVEYTATLNEDAILGNQGNLNTGSLEFSNNPNEEQSGDKEPETGKTPKDSVIVFTYKVVANKVDENEKMLPGAAFKLEKKNSDGEYKIIALVNAEGNDESGYTIKDGTKTTFEWKGIDDGTYRLTEIITPNGYNTIDPIEFTVTADHQTTFDFGTRTEVLTSLNGNKVSGDVTEGTLTTDVVNKKGSTLPTTGGIGTTIFYVIGSVLVLGAAVLLITKKRMSTR